MNFSPFLVDCVVRGCAGLIRTQAVMTMKVTIVIRSVL